MQRGARDRDTAALDRFEFRHRRQNAGTPDLNGNILHRCRHLTRGKFVRDRPARAFEGKPQLLLLFQRIDLDDNPVDLIRNCIALALIFLTTGHHLIDRPAQPALTIDAQSPIGDRGQEFPLRFERSCSFENTLGVLGQHTERMNKTAQIPLRRDPRIEQFDRPAGGVTGIGENGFTIFLRSLFKAAKSFKFMYTSPRTSRTSGRCPPFSPST